MGNLDSRRYVPPSGAAATGNREQGLATLIRQELAPIAEKIDQEGYYPQTFLQNYGRQYGFGNLADVGTESQAPGIRGAIIGMESCAQQCGATGFLIWCQTACAWYLHNSSNTALKRRFLRRISLGEQIAGTALSNLLKARSGLEDMRLRATSTASGYCLNGSLPWVSNLAPGGVFAVAAIREDGGTVMALIATDTAGLSLRPSGPFLALEGTATMSCRFTNVFVAPTDILAEADEFKEYFERMRPGMILAQMGMALGIAHAAVSLIEEVGAKRVASNAFLDHQPQDLREQLNDLRQKTLVLATRIETPRPGLFKETLSTRLQGSELALDAAHSALLHCGACGYLKRHPAQRRLREAYFVAIVTPALKHLRREIALLDASERSTIAC